MTSMRLARMAFSMSSIRRTAPSRARPTLSRRATIVSPLLVLARAASKSAFDNAGSTHAAVGDDQPGERHEALHRDRQRERADQRNGGHENAALDEETHEGD